MLFGNSPQDSSGTVVFSFGVAVFPLFPFPHQKRRLITAGKGFENY
jgi:hypothetical protein